MTITTASRPQRDDAAQGANSLSGSELVRGVLDAIEDQVCVIDAAGTIAEVNRSWARWLLQGGYGPGGAIGESFDRLCRQGGVYGDAASRRVLNAIGRVSRGEVPRADGQFLTQVAGEHRTLRMRVTPLGSSPGWVLLSQSDVTEAVDSQLRLVKEKQKAELLAGALETSQTSLELAVKGGNLGLWHWDVTTGYFELSADWLESLGHRGLDLGADIQSFRKLLHEDDLVLWTDVDSRSVGPEEPYDRQFRFRRGDGGYSWVHALGRANSHHADGSPESMAGILIDIDARKQAQLRDLGIAKILEESLLEVYAFDADSLLFVEVNRGARNNLGYSLEELRRLTPLDIKPRLDRESFERLVAPLRMGSRPRVEFETVHRRRDGSEYPVLVGLQKTELLARPVFVAFVVDVTERLRLEEQLAQAQKLESVGQLAAGIAHELNTPLQYVCANLRYLSDGSRQLFETISYYEGEFARLGGAPGPGRDGSPGEGRRDGAEGREAFERIRAELPQAIADSLSGVDHVLTIVRAMREFCHPGDQQKVATDLNRAIESTATITSNRWKYAADLRLELAPDLPHVSCEPGSISQVLVNLIVNAADAVADKQGAEGGAARGTIVVRSRTEGHEVVLEVEDDGCGMPEAVRRRVFDPFYTTKEVGRGTGQGLALTHTIVTQKHAGSISVESEAGVGTTFRVRLPIEPPESRVIEQVTSSSAPLH